MTLRYASIAVVFVSLAGCGGKVVIDATAGGGSGDAGSDAPPKVILANNGETLYAVRHPAAGSGLAQVEVVATFQGCEDVADLAMNSAGKLYATTPAGFYTIDPSSGTCTLVATGAYYPDALAFVPPGTADSSEEALVGYAGASYVRIDPSTGAITPLGQLGSGLMPSGDVAADALGNVFLTVKGEGCNDCLVRVDPKTGALAEMIDTTYSPDVFGLAYADGALYGFANDGEIMQFDLSTGSQVALSRSGPAGMHFSGATTEP